MVEDPRRPLLKTTAPLRELPTPIASNRPPASLTCGTRQWQSPVSRSTTYRGLRFHGFSSRIPCTKPLLSCKQKKKRLQFAQKYSKWTVEDWKQVIFSDESKFVMGYGNKGPRVWRQKYERHKAVCLKRSVKHPASVMVWGCVSSRGVGSLCFLSPKTTVNTEMYIDLLDAYLLPFVDKLFADDDFVFQHDLAPAHRSYKTAKYLKEKRIDILEWPCNSPDLNIIEFVWQKMKTRVQQVHLKTLEELKAVLHEVWASFTQNELEEMVESMPRRIHEVICEERRCNEVLTLTCISLNFFIIQILFRWINKRSLACNLKKCGKYS